MADERDPRAERFERYLDALLAGGRPSPEDVESGDEAEMARLAAEIAGAVRDDSAEPDPAFVEQLRLRMRAADAGLASVQVPPPVRDKAVEPAGHRPWRLTRRQLLQGAIGAAAGLAAGLIGVSVVPRTPADAPTLGGSDDLVAGDGFWEEVALLADLPPGTAARFSTAAFDGFIVNDAGEVRALSSVCTHMGCTLQYRPDWQDLRCPCHGASFDLAGRLANGRSTWRDNPYPGDARAYPIALPDLVRPRVKVQDGAIMVWTAQA
ncbi:MAG TPA: Rieske (2Fe-2S) protein [Candidatus Limnocylindrales bacterium]|nr:Rieske (2Fe-2S) protein [Candidatus Limnocylindrales bacterium]